MLHSAAQVRSAFDRLGLSYIEFAKTVTSDQLNLAGLGRWSVRELLGHGLRAFSTTQANLDAAPTVEFEVHSAGEYYRLTFASSPTVHTEIAARGVQSGIELGDNIAEVVERTVTSACARVGAAPDDAIVNHFVGQVPLLAYLATRVVEAGVHLMDLQRATGTRPTLDATTAGIIVLTLTETGDAGQIIFALTGRAPLPEDFNVLR